MESMEGGGADRGGGGGGGGREAVVGRMVTLGGRGIQIGIERAIPSKVILNEA